MSHDRDHPDLDRPEGVLPAKVRYPLIVVLVGIGLVCLVTVIYDAGWLPVAGPFAAVVIAAVIVFVVMWWRARRLRRLAASAAEQLRQVGAAIAHERQLARAQRTTGASDESLEQASRQAASALQRLAWGHEQGAALLLDDLAATARPSWRPDAPLTQQVQTTGADGDRDAGAGPHDAGRCGAPQALSRAQMHPVLVPVAETPARMNFTPPATLTP